MFNLKQSYFKKARNLVICVKQFINFLRGNRLQNWKKLNKQILNFKNKNKEKKNSYSYFGRWIKILFSFRELNRLHFKF